MFLNHQVRKSDDFTYHYNNTSHTLTKVTDTHNASIKIRDFTAAGSYDSSGNVLKNGSRNFTFNINNQMTASGNSRFYYDGFGRRIKTQKDNGDIDYSVYSSGGKLLHRTNNTGGINYIFLGNKLVAKAGIGITTSDDSLMHYKPFGESIEEPKDDVGYTGHKFDKELGLSYMQARYYDPMIGRFYSNDPVGYTAANPVMSFNRYLYVNNNPYKYTDPNGEFLNFIIGAAVGAITEAAVQVAFEGRSITDLDGGAILQSAAIGSLSGGVGGATSKLAGKVIQSATKPANAFGNGASKVVTGAASGSLGGAAAGGATNSAVTQLVETGTIDGGQVADAATTGLVTGGLGGAVTGQVRANAANATLGSSRANPVFTSAQPGERAATVTGAAASAMSTTAVKAEKSCEAGNC